MKKGIYAIHDNKAQDIVSILQVHIHEAVAIRTFTDIALSERSAIQQHPEDFDLIRLGFLDISDNTHGGRIGLIPAYQLVLTGAALMAALTQQNTKEPNAS